MKCFLFSSGLQTQPPRVAASICLYSLQACFVYSPTVTLSSTKNVIHSQLFAWYCLNIEPTELECVYGYNQGQAAINSVHVMYSGLECFASCQPHNMLLRYLSEHWPLLLQLLLQCNTTYHTTSRHFSLSMMPH